MKNKLSVIFTILVILSTVFMAIKPVDIYHTARGMQAAVRELPGTALFRGNGLIVYTWEQGMNYAFSMTKDTEDVSTQLGEFRNGTLVGVTTMGQFIKWLQLHGYQQITAKQLPKTVTAKLLSTGWSLFATAYEALPTFGVLIIDKSIPLDPDKLGGMNGDS